VFNGTFSTAGYIVPQEYEIYREGPGDKIHNKTLKQYTKPKKS